MVASASCVTARLLMVGVWAIRAIDPSSIVNTRRSLFIKFLFKPGYNFVMSTRPLPVCKPAVVDPLVTPPVYAEPPPPEPPELSQPA